MVPIHGGQRRDLRNVTVTLASAPFWSEKHTFHLSRHLKFHLKSKQREKGRGSLLPLLLLYVDIEMETDGHSIN